MEHGFGVVIEHFGSGVHHGLKSLAVTFEIGDQNLYLRPGRPAASLSDRLGKDPRPTVV